MLSSSSGSMLPVSVLALESICRQHDDSRIAVFPFDPCTHPQHRPLHLGHLSPRKGLWQIVWVFYFSGRGSWDM